MAHVMFGGLTHKPAAELAELLLKVVPANMQHVFFADSGSVSVEVAMKMALQYCQVQGVSKKSKFLALKHASMVIRLARCRYVTLFRACIICLPMCYLNIILLMWISKLLLRK